MNENNDFFNSFAIPQCKDSIKEELDFPILYCDEKPNLNVLIAEYFSDRQIRYIVSFFHLLGARINLVYVFSTIVNEKRNIVGGIIKFFYTNVRKDLTDWLDESCAVVCIGRAIYATTYDSDIKVSGFYDSVFNNTYFYSPFINNRVYPIDTIFKILTFGDVDKKTGEIKERTDVWETHFAQEQIKRAIKAGNCQLSRKRCICWKSIDNPNEWLKEKTENISENELWVAVDTETDGLDKLSNHIGDLTLSFDGWTAYHIFWKDVNPRIFTDFAKKHKCILANGKFDVLFFMYHGCDLIVPSWDTMIAGHLLNEMRSNSLKTHAFCYTNYGGYDLDLECFKWKYPGLKSYLQIPDNIRIPYACMDAAITYQVWQKELTAMQKEPQMLEYFYSYCIPMLKVFIKAEFRGFCVNWEKVTSVGIIIQENIRKAIKSVQDAFHNPVLNPSKKQELGKFIESLGWPCITRGKAGFYKVSKIELAEWQKMGYKEVDSLLEYSRWVTIWNTFIGEDSIGTDDCSAQDDENNESFFDVTQEGATDNRDATGLWQYKSVDNRVHTTYHAFMTNSHRHRSSNPNLQNIPHHDKEAASIVRQCYIPPDIIKCLPQDAQQIWLFDRLNGVCVCRPSDRIEIGMRERIKIYAKDLWQYSFDEYGFYAEWYKFTEDECDKDSAQFIEINDDKLGWLRLKKDARVKVKTANNDTCVKNAKDIAVGDEILSVL